MTIRELLAEESPTLRRRLASLFPACRMKHRPVRSPAPPERWWCGRTPLPLRLCAGGGPGRRLRAPARRPLPHLLRVRPPHPLRGVRGPVRGKLLSGRGACQNRLPVLGARPGGLLLLVLLRPGHHPLPGTGGGAQPVGAGPAGAGLPVSGQRQPPSLLPGLLV